MKDLVQLVTHFFILHVKSSRVVVINYTTEAPINKVYFANVAQVAPNDVLWFC